MTPSMTRLEQLRVDEGLSIRELSLKAGVPRSAISNAEERKGASPRALAKLGTALGVPAHTLLLKVTPEIVEPIPVEERQYPDLPDAA